MSETLSINKQYSINPTKFPNHPVERSTSVNKIIIHYTGAPKQRAPITCQYFKQLASSKRNRIASSHYVVDLDGTIYQFIPLEFVAWHAGNDSVNRSSIGIEMCCDSPNTFTKETIEATERLTAALMNKYHIKDMKNVLRHYDITKKICPKPFVDNKKRWEEFKAGVASFLKTDFNITASNTPNVDSSSSSDNSNSMSSKLVKAADKGLDLVNKFLKTSTFFLS